MPRLSEADGQGAHDGGEAPVRTAPADLRMPLLGVVAWTAGLAATLLPVPGVAVALGIGWIAYGWGVVVGRRTRSAPPVEGTLGSPALHATLVSTGVAALLVASAVAGSAALRQEAVATSPVADLADQRAAVSVTGVLVSDPRPVTGPFGTQVVVRLEVREVVGRGLQHRLAAPLLVIGTEEWSAVPLGARVTTWGRLAPPDDADLAGVLAGAATPRVVAEPDAWWRGADVVRGSIRDAVAGRPDDQRALVPALVDGDDAGLDLGLEEDFRTTGLTHLTAVSGTNLTLVVGFLLTLARWCRVRGRWLLLVGGLGIVGFVLLARTEPSVVRAAAMGTVGLLALGAGGRQRALRGLGVAVVALLLVQPALAVSVGFALSVLATAGIVVLGPGWRDALARWLPRWLAEAVAVPAAAQLACTPVVAAISGQVSLVAVLANLLVAPLVGPATVLGLAGGVVGLLPDPVGGLLGPLAGTAAGWCVAWIIVVARRGADLPLAAIDWGTGGLALAALVTLSVLAALLVPLVVRRLRAGPTVLVVGAVVLVVALVGRLPWPGLRGQPGWPGEDWVLAACDVGQGDALVLRAGPAAGVVVDAGPDPGAVDGCLSRLGVREVPLLVLTHFHADHVDGLDGVLDDRRVNEVWTTSTLDPPAAVGTVAGEASDAGVAAHLAPYGVARRVGEVTVQTLWPLPGAARPGAGDGSSANDASVVLLAEVRGVRILLTGDLEPPGQAALARAVPDLEVDVLKVPHHGSRYQDLDWLTSLGARVAVVSVGADNDYGHPAGDVLAALEGAGVEVARTDESGDVLVTATGPDGQGLALRSSD